MQKVNYYVFKENGVDETIVIIVEDGGVATTYNPYYYWRTDYYGERITKDTTVENIWEELDKGNMFHSGGKWIDQEPTEQELIDDMLEWLYVSTEPVEFIRHDMGNMTKENFEEVKSKLKLES